MVYRVGAGNLCCQIMVLQPIVVPQAFPALSFSALSFHPTVSLQRLIVAAEQFSQHTLHLTSEQQHYLHRVLRLKTGQQFLALDGRGGQWVATLTDRTDRATLKATAALPPPAPFYPPVTLAIAIPKGGGFDELVRQTTELGVATLQPVITERTLHRPNPKKLERWQRIAAEATEQSERLWLPEIKPPLPWADVVHQSNGRRFICVARRSAPPLLRQLQYSSQAPGSAALTIATGPEGGWTPAEIDQALGADFLPVSLGPQVLRAVTAPLAALALAQAVASCRGEA
jgi:16S rRNA (uracil1498-N3)-methyltransferase